MYYSVYKLKMFCISSAQNAKSTISYTQYMYMTLLYVTNKLIKHACMYCTELFIHRFILWIMWTVFFQYLWRISFNLQIDWR